MAINYKMLPINFLQCKEEETEYKLTKLSGFLEETVSSVWFQWFCCGLNRRSVASRSEIFVGNGEGW